jgi:hypothetical protein
MDVPSLAWYGWVLVVWLLLSGLGAIWNGATKYVPKPSNGGTVAFGVILVMLVFIWLVFFP